MARIQLRRDTAAAWVAANPVLADAEVGVERDTGKFKVGNGVTQWSGLDYFTVGGAGGGATDPEVVRDTIAAALVPGSNIDIVVDDTANTITISAIGGTGGTGTIDETNLVHKSGTETITGNKDFTGTLTKSGQAVVTTNDARMTDSRPPTIHAAAHATAGSDPISPASIGAATAADVAAAGTSAPTASTVVRRDASGRTRVQDPVDDQDAASKGYVEQQITARVGNLTLDLSAIPRQLFRDGPSESWSGGNVPYTQDDIAAIRPAPIVWMCPVGSEPTWGTNDWDANETYHDRVATYA